MPITDTTYVERVLIVLSPDGSLKGAHQESLRTIADGDSVISAQMLPAAPLDAATLATILPGTTALLAQVEALTNDLAAMTAARDAALAAVPPTPAADTIDGVPQVVTNYQARAALIGVGLFEQVDSAVKAQGPATAAYQAWEYANQVYRTSDLIVGLGQALGLTSEQIDALFVAAARIE